MQRLLREKQTLPDFILVDGGRAQITAGLRALEDASVGELGVIGLAKGKEELNFSWRKGSMQLPATSAAARLLQKMRNEAHRFALAYHRKLRTKETIRSELDMIEGVGSERKKALLRRFGSVRALRMATVEEVSTVEGVGQVLAKRIASGLRGRGSRVS